MVEKINKTLLERDYPHDERNILTDQSIQIAQLELLAEISTKLDVLTAVITEKETV